MGLDLNDDQVRVLFENLVALLHSRLIRARVDGIYVIPSVSSPLGGMRSAG